jgi:dUTPase
MLRAIESFCAIPCHRGKNNLEWAGNNALDLMARLYDGAPVFLRRKRDLYLDWSTWVPGLGGTGNHGRELQFRWVKCLPEGCGPRKAHASDSGYDITLVRPGKRTGRVQFFHTGVKVQPSYGWYFDLVPRSSISKTGYMLANSVGVIDRTYVGEVLVPLIKIDDQAADLELPARVV